MIRKIAVQYEDCLSYRAKKGTAKEAELYWRFAREDHKRSDLFESVKNYYFFFRIWQTGQYICTRVSEIAFNFVECV